MTSAATSSQAQANLVRDRRIVLWPWQLEASGEGLHVVAVANPALEAVLVRVGDRVVPKSPQDAYRENEVAGYQLICRVIEAPGPAAARPGHGASPRIDRETGHVVVDQLPHAQYDGSDPRLLVPRPGSGLLGIRLPSISHHRRVVLKADGSLAAVGDVVLPDSTRFETLGKEDPSVTWFEGVPFLSYVGVSDFGITPVLARGSVQDGAITYERVGEAQGHHDNRDVKILPKRAQGKMWRHDRPNTLPWGPKRVYLAWSADEGASWSASLPLFEGEAAWERGHIGAGCVPFVHQRPDGSELMVSFYHGVEKRQGAVAGVYQTGMAAFDVAEPGRMLGRFGEPLVPVWDAGAFLAARQAACPLDEAQFQALHGLFVVEPVIFSTGHTRVGDRQVLFSGLNDCCIERLDLPPMETLLTHPAYQASSAP